jgi:AraC-like DNA-binding protein
MSADAPIVERRDGPPRGLHDAPPAAERARRAGAYNTIDVDVDTPRHAHAMHQLLFAFEGSVELESGGRLHLLPAQQAAWIPAGVAHVTRIRRVRSGAVFFAPDMVAEPGDRVRILAAAPVIREMVQYAGRWPIGEARGADEARAEAFFQTLADLCQEWIAAEAPLSLPVSDDPALRRAMHYAQANLAAAEIAAACRAAGLSERSLRRRFEAETGMSWRRYLQQARLVRAMALLSEPRASLAETADEVGFASLSAFSKAFREASGQTPAAWRRRTRAAVET